MEKTIKMPADLLAKWLVALRSGEYKQASGTLYSASQNGYCCLGVLQMAVDGCVERKLEDGRPETAPTSDWLMGHGVEFLGPEEVSGADPWLPILDGDAEGGRASAMWANDSGGKSFPQIADAIEACAEGY
jgi:hypothetical protein